MVSKGKNGQKGPFSTFFDLFFGFFKAIREIGNRTTWFRGLKKDPLEIYHFLDGFEVVFEGVLDPGDPV